jgi:hypothetical protein
MRNFLWAILFAMLANNPATNAQTAAIFPQETKLNRLVFFSEEKPLQMTISTDFKKLLGQRKKGAFQPANATVFFTEKDSVNETIDISTRGIFRLKQCNMPGLMLSFKNSTEPTTLSPLKKMKLVCGCSRDEYGEQLVLMEYLIYKMYNLVTDMSFKVRLARINYVDTKEKFKPYRQYAFLIEDVDDMAKRNNCREVEGITFNTEQTNRQQTTIVSLFQYMIGNTDWTIPNYHNVKLMRSRMDSLSSPFVVPYDFDFAGAINARYATPAEELGIEKVTDRLYRGFTREMAELQIALDLFRGKKDGLLTVIKSFELLNKRQRDEFYRYVNEFYDIIENKNQVQSIFIDGARKE